MPDQETRDKLQKALKEAAGKPMTREMIRRQKVSFILGTLGDDSTITRKQIEAYLDKQEGVATRS